MSFPINGRIAIVDDNINQAIPLIEVLSKKQYPLTYYSGEVKFLPDKNDFCNDIRVIFLDINLIDDSEHEDKILKAKLVPVLSRIISPFNFPFVIVYWSRNETHKELIKEIFETDLKDRKPIGYLEERKLNYFNYDGTPSVNQEDSINKLFLGIDELFNQNPAFSYLLDWENRVHVSADKSLEEIFNFVGSQNSWENDANTIFNKLGSSYSGKHYDLLKPEEKINSSFQAFNSIFLDTLEFVINQSPVANPQVLTSTGTYLNIIPEINKKLLITEDIRNIKYTGLVLQELKVSDSLASELVFLRVKEKEMEGLKKSIGDNLIDIIVNVTPLCDFIQQKQKYDRFVKGILIEAQYRQYIDDKSEALFFSPNFQFKSLNYFLLLDYRYFFTCDIQPHENLKPIFRLRQQVLSEVQSKLSRHISRQGILFL